MSDLRNYVVNFEILAAALFSQRQLLKSDLAQLTTLDWGRKIFRKELKQKVSFPSTKFFFQYLADKFFTDLNWNVVCYPPGLPYLNLPGINLITARGELGENTLTAQWGIFLVDKNGRRANKFILKVTTKGNSVYWRTCTIARAQICHTILMDNETRSRSLQLLDHAQEELEKDNPNYVRDYEIKSEILSDLDSMARSFFGAAWDLLSEICGAPTDSVVSGLWRYPDTTAQILRSKIALVHEIANIFLLPVNFSYERLRLRIFEWLIIDKNECNQVKLLNTLEVLGCSQKLWFESACVAIAHAMYNKGVIHSKKVENLLIKNLSGDKQITVAQKQLKKCIAFLITNGHYDWAFKLEKLIYEHDTQNEDEVVLMRRLRGLKFFAGQNLRQSARILGISYSKAKYLTYYKYKNVLNDSKTFSATNKGTVNSDNLIDYNNQKKVIPAGILSDFIDVTVFDDIQSLFKLK